MDDRIRAHAETLVDWGARIEAGDDVVISVAEDAHDLAVATAAVLGERGANVFPVYGADEVQAAYLSGHDGEFEDDPSYVLSMYERADSVLTLGGGSNTAAMADVPGERLSSYRRARESIREALLDTDWMKTVHPTRSLAQQAGMSLPAYRDFAYNAILRDWEALADEMAQLKTLLDDGDSVRLVRGTEELKMSIAGRQAINSAASVAYNSHNLPSGEVFTAPYETTGTVSFDVPMTIDGRPIRDVTLTFEDGAVVDVSAAQGDDVIRDVIDTDAGARRVGELGIGMNRGIDRITDNILFDEKMGETVHIALGHAYEDCLPPGERGNDSAVHTDLITDMSEDSRLEIDGAVVQRNGKFRWEDGFEPE